ncbi:hypothetical protein AAVH_35642, partial [Aphelenchoides avenae]
TLLVCWFIVLCVTALLNASGCYKTFETNGIPCEVEAIKSPHFRILPLPQMPVALIQACVHGLVQLCDLLASRHDRHVRSGHHSPALPHISARCWRLQRARQKQTSPGTAASFS